ncbi:1-phosphofructokinase family hexose kinase [bacterium]|nr:1-phosphofructokinase family hexose kinase [bacterium]
MFVTLTLSPAVDCTLAVEGSLALGQVHRVITEVRTPGGKGINVAKILARHGVPVVAGGIIGEDHAAFFERFLEGLGVDPFFMAVPDATRTNIMASDQDGQEIKFNRAAFPDLAPDWDALRAYCTRLAARGEVVIISGSLPARFPADTYARLVRLFHEAGRSVALDTSGPALALAAREHPAVIKPNRAELKEMMGSPVNDERQVVAIMRSLVKKHAAVIVSDADKGAWFADNALLLHAAAPDVTAVDTTGAGDALLGQFCFEFFARSGRRLTRECAARAVAAGSACVEVRGTPVLDPRRVDELAAQTTVRELSVPAA